MRLVLLLVLLWSLPAWADLDCDEVDDRLTTGLDQTSL